MEGSSANWSELDTTITTLDPNINHYPIVKEATRIFLSIHPFICIGFGIPGNLLSFIIMGKPGFKGTTTAFFIRVLAVSDTLYCFGLLLWQTIVHSKGAMIEANILYYFCAFGLINYQSIMATSRNLLAVMTLDKLVAILFPFKAITLSTIRNAKIGVCFVLGMVLLEGSPLLFVRYNPTFYFWTCPYWLPDFINEYYMYCTGVLTMTEVAILITSNLIIVIKLKRDGRRRLAMKQSQETTGDDKATKHITKMLLVTTSFFIVTIGFGAVFSDYIMVQNPEWTARNPDLSTLWYEVDTFLEALNYSINFYLFYASSRKVRKCVKKMFSSSSAEQISTANTTKVSYASD